MTAVSLSFFLYKGIMSSLFVNVVICYGVPYACGEPVRVRHGLRVFSTHMYMYIRTCTMYVCVYNFTTTPHILNRQTDGTCTCVYVWVRELAVQAD